MMTLLDALVIIFMAMVGVAFLGMILMFLVKKTKVKQIGLYLTLISAVIAGGIGVEIGALDFPVQTAVGIAVILAAAAAFVWERRKKKMMYAQIVASFAVVIGIVNAFF